MIRSGKYVLANMKMCMCAVCLDGADALDCCAGDR